VSNADAAIETPFVACDDAPHMELLAEDVLPEEAVELKRQAREFAAEHVEPNAADYFASREYPMDVVEAAREQDLVVHEISPEYGGKGRSLAEVVAVVVDPTEAAELLVVAVLGHQPAVGHALVVLVVLVAVAEDIDHLSDAHPENTAGQHDQQRWKRVRRARRDRAERLSDETHYVDKSALIPFNVSFIVSLLIIDALIRAYHR